MTPPVLVAYRALGLGDLLTAVPALRALAAAFPGYRRMLAAPRGLAGLAELTGAVDEVIDVVSLGPLPRCLHRADVAVNLHGRVATWRCGRDAVATPTPTSPTPASSRSGSTTCGTHSMAAGAVEAWHAWRRRTGSTAV